MEISTASPVDVKNWVKFQSLLRDNYDYQMHKEDFF
jgi:hypothetical protein